MCSLGQNSSTCQFHQFRQTPTQTKNSTRALNRSEYIPIFITFPENASMWNDNRYAPNKKPKTGPNAAMLYMKPEQEKRDASIQLFMALNLIIKYLPIYIEELSFFTWSSTYVVPNVNRGDPPHPSKTCARTKNNTGPNVDGLLSRQLFSLWDDRIS